MLTFIVVKQRNMQMVEVAESGFLFYLNLSSTEIWEEGTNLKLFEPINKSFFFIKILSQIFFLLHIFFSPKKINQINDKCIYLRDRIPSRMSSLFSQ